MPQSTHSRYQQAQALVQGIMTRKVVLNDGVFPHWIAGTNSFWYQRDTATGVEFRVVNAGEGSNNIAFDHQALASALAAASDKTVDPNNLDIKINDLTLHTDNAVAASVLFTAFKQQWQFDAHTGQCRRVDKVETPPCAQQALTSPDGKRQVFTRDHNLWLRDIASGSERALTTDGSADNTYASAPASPQLQVLWSPDAKQLLTHRLDLRQVASRPCIDHVPTGETVHTQLSHTKMAYPGDDHIEAYQLLCINIESGKTLHADRTLPLWNHGQGFFTDQGLGWWHQDSRSAYFVELTRGAKAARLIAWDTHTGHCKTLVEEHSETFIDLAHNDGMPVLTPLPDSNEVIWFSERSGWAHLYLYDANNGQLKHAITEGEWLVRSILQVDTERRELILHTGARDKNISPHYRDICKVNIDSGELTDIATGNYEHSVFGANLGRQAGARGGLGVDSAGAEGISPDGQFIVTTRSRVDTLPESILLDRDGNHLMTLETAEGIGLPDNWVWPKPVTTVAADGQTDIHGVVYFPPGYSDKNPQHYPVLDFSCGQPGFTMIPQGAFINGPCIDYPYLYGAAFAALGCVVVALEGRGMPNREKAFHDHCYGAMASACELKDRVAGIQQLAEIYPAMNINRVGIVGGDGFSSPVYGLLEHPDFYRVGVAMASEDARYKSVALGECYEPHFLHNVQGDKHKNPHRPYADKQASALQGKLLLIHGMMDMFMPQSATFRLVNAIQAANRDVDLMLMPQVGHDIPAYALRRTWDYLVKHLLGEEPPVNFELTTGLDILMAKL